MVPPQGKKVKWNLLIFPKGVIEDETRYVKVGMEVEDYEDDLDVDRWLYTDDVTAQFQIETAYSFRHSVETGPIGIDMSRSLSFLSFHSSRFKQDLYRWLEDSYEVGTVEDRAVDGFLTFEFEIRTYLAPKLKFQCTTDKQEFVNNFEEFHLDGDGDVKICCGGKEFRCHKLLLTSQSPVFKAMFDQEGSKESIENVVDIQDCTPEAVKDFVFFLYNAKLRPAKFTSADLELMFGLIHLTSKYQVSLLMNSCIDVLMDIMSVDNVLRILVVVNKYELGSHVSDSITDMVCDFMKKNIAVIVEKDEWDGFVAEYPSLVKNLILDMNNALKTAESCDICDGKDIICADCNE